MTTLGRYTRWTLGVLALSVATISATGPSHVVGLQTPATQAEEPALFGFDPKWLVSTGGLLLCVLILTKLLRDTQADLRGEREENRKAAAAHGEKMEAALRAVASASQAQAVATERVSTSLNTNTSATQALAHEVRTLADRRREDRA